MTAPFVHDRDWPDTSDMWEAGYGRLSRPLDGHTWFGDVDLAGFRYLGRASQEVKVDIGRSVLVLRLYCKPPAIWRPETMRPVGGQ